MNMIRATSERSFTHWSNIIFKGRCTFSSSSTSTSSTSSDTTTTSSSAVTNERISKILSQFPTIKYGFAYGSGVIPQKGYNAGATSISLDKMPMIDLVFAVDNTLEWHKENIERNFHHYSFLAYMGEQSVNHVQKMAAKVYYNTLLKHEGIRYKYGVIEYGDLIDDLRNWDSLYVSGRMMKPILQLPNLADGGEHMSAVNRDSNLLYAISCAVLTLPSEFSEYELYHMISSISYMGDIRMRGGENPNKIHNIVVNNLESMRAIYMPLIKQHFGNNISIGHVDNTGLHHFIKVKIMIMIMSCRVVVVVSITNNVVVIHNSAVVSNLRKNLRGGKVHVEPQVVTKCIQDIVGRSSFTQSAKGVLTAGLTKSLEYIYLKLQKSSSK
ncbi:hypothetical protein SAMD00019534_006060 [Acytostelium subglobosum LB1]|uniref:hypothetical protein n=1 Tax=Acytostelium subglobosum LB1 TaxID=1410327 RepID=UPI000644C153|nr:hypothetical protein SAMD00019534_006060 [Acytostelium subglobosum LB1]GAM17431.1 hypothetical protein SAMD00019534_006060 [Acytostelium subglobosum LB1]|eukprot:XP_012759493.1 hypothetical protein SAMD00019534_006060 [Acytostelium subglobosum LB1]